MENFLASLYPPFCVIFVLIQVITICSVQMPLVKDTSLAFSIGIAEMFTQSRALVTSQRSMLPFAIAALIYWETTGFMRTVDSNEA